MRPLWAHLWAEFLGLLREPLYLLATLALPAFFFAMFAAPNARDAALANRFLASWGVYAVFGVVFFQYGVGLAQERTSPWTLFLRALPLSPGVRLAARVLASLLMALLAFAVLVLVALALTPARLGVGEGARLLLALLLGGVPAGLLGAVLGLWASPRAALAVGQLLYLLLSYLGGLWVPPEYLPAAARALSPYLFTRAWAELAWGAVAGGSWAVPSLVLLLYALVLLPLALLLWRRAGGFVRGLG